MKLRYLLLAIIISSPAYAEQPSIKPANMQAFSNFINAMYDDEKTTFDAGGESYIGDGLTSITASQAIEDYKANELKGNKKYKDKYVRIKSIASAIKEGIADKPYIVANGKNQFENIAIYINPNDDRYLNISKGDKIDLICKGKGVVMGSPLFDNCLFPSDYSQKAIKILHDDAINAASKGNLPSIQLNAYLLLTFLAIEDKVKDDCLKDSKQCFASSLKLLKSKDFESSYFSNEKMKSIKSYYQSSIDNLPHFKTL